MASVKSSEQPITQRVNRAIRDGAPALRRLYSAARQTGAIVRDWRRRAIVRSLSESLMTIPRESGFLVMPPGVVDGVDVVVDEARQALVRFDRDTPPAGRSKKRFLVNVLNREALSLTSPVMAFALREDILTVVTRYFGLAPLLTSISVFHSDTVDGVPTSSQLYHCDADDITQVKIFIYCSDVDAGSGPFTLVDAATTERVQRHTEYRYGSRLTDKEVHEAGGLGGEHAIVGPSGTVAFIDTSRCLHFGSRVASDAPPRLVAMVQYLTPYSFMLPFQYRSAVPFRRLLDPSLTALQRLALGE